MDNPDCFEDREVLWQPAHADRSAEVAAALGCEGGARTILLHDDGSSDFVPQREVAPLLRELQRLAALLAEVEEQHAATLGRLGAEQRSSALNLLRYRVARQQHSGSIAAQLGALGIAEIGAAGPDVLGRVQAALRLLQALVGPRTPRVAEPEAPAMPNPAHVLQSRAHALFGPEPRDRAFRIMLTLPSSAADDPQLVREALAAGADCVRINCAHDGPEVWQRMIVHVRRAERELGRRCVVLMDLAGPKLRTGPIEPGPAVMHWKPMRDARGRVRAPARIWLSPWPHPEPAPSGSTARLLLPEHWVAKLRPGDIVGFTDARGARRRLRIEVRTGRSFWALSKRTCYIAPETEFRLLSAGRESRPTTPCDIPRRPGAIRLRLGDFLDLVRDPVAGIEAEHDAAGQLQLPATISCTLPEVLDCVRPGEPVWFDDGKIGGIVRGIGATGVRIEITRAKPGGAKLRSDRGINFPDTEWQAPALTNLDIAHLALVAQHADLVGLSFVQCPEDVIELRSRLRACGGEHLGVLLKVETQNAAWNLVDILLAASRLRAVGVMIARGDLAVECGWERLAGLQEEILRVCTAAHVPVVWATQVLESLAKNGVPSRPEITDAAMGRRAACVMLNKGPHVIDAIALLNALPAPAVGTDQRFGDAMPSPSSDGADSGWFSGSRVMERSSS